MADFARSAHPGVQEQLDRLSMLSPAGDHLGLERIAAVLDRLGRPQDRLPPVFHVAGTNGKGSTVAFLRAGLEAGGYKVHAFTSPHLVRFNERIRVAGQLIDDETLADLLAEVLDAGRAIQPSFFEVATATALLAFSRTHAEACLLEVGLGGRLDATNVIDRPLVTGIASIGLDHQHYLGKTIAEIAGEKAGIAKTGVPLVSVAQLPQAEGAIERVADMARAPLLLEGRDWLADREFGSALPGGHQQHNASLAWQMLCAQQMLQVSEEQFRLGISRTRWPARLQRLAPGPLIDDREVWLDGGHNPSAASQIAAYAKHQWGDGKPLHLIFASLSTKDPSGMLEPFKGIAVKVHAVPIPDHSCFAPDELVEVAAGLGITAEAHEDVAQALGGAPADARVLIFGSLYLAGTVLGANHQVPD